MQEIIDIAKAKSTSTGRTITVYPEAKNPYWNNQQAIAKSCGTGSHPFEDAIVKLIKDNNLNTKTSPIFVQGFDPATLKYMRIKAIDANRAMGFMVGRRDEEGFGGRAANVRDKVVGVYEKAGFPRYRTANDGYPEATDIDYRLLVGYGANADRYEDWRTNATPLRDSQQPLAKQEPLKWYAANATTHLATTSSPAKCRANRRFTPRQTSRSPRSAPAH